MKKALKITAWVVGVFLFLDLLLVGLLFVPAIQTFVVHKVTTVLSEKWGTEISIGDIHITPTFKLVAHEVAIKDHHDENMIYSGTVKGRLRGIKTKPFRLSLGNVEFHDLDVVLRTYKDEEIINIAKWASVFKSDKPKSGFVLTSNSVDIKNGRFVLINDNTRVVYDTAGRPGIDYAFLELADLDIEAKDFRLNGADVAMNFKQLAFSQYGGFQLQHGSGDFRICDTTLTFDNLKLKTAESDLDLDLAFKYSKWKSYGDFLDSVNIHAAIRPSTLAMDDIAGWAPAIRGMNEVFQLQADTVSGTVNDFRLKNVSANWLDDNLVQGDIAIRDVTHFKDADFDVTLDSSVVNLADLSRFTIPGGKSLKSNKTLNKLGTATVSGTFQGGLSQFNTDLQANTGLGNIKAVLSTDTQDGHLVFDGNVTSKNFRLAKLTGKGKVLGTSNLNLQFDGQTASTGFTADNLKTVSAHVGGDLRTFPVLGYPIRNIHLDGDYQDGLLNATMNANDPNLQCNVIAQLDNTQSVPYLQGSIDLPKFAAGAIAQKMPAVDSASAKGIYKVISTLQRNPALQLSFDHFQISMHGSNLDNCNGFLGCDNLKLTFSEDSIANDRLRLTAINSDRLHKYILSSSLASATYESTYPIASVKDSLQSIAHNLFPSLIAAAKGERMEIGKPLLTAGDADSYIKFNARTYNTRAVTKLFYPDLFIAPGSTVNLDIRANHVDDRVEVDLPFFGIRNKVRLHNFHLDGQTTDAKTLALKVNGDSVLVHVGNGNLLFDKTQIEASAANDLIRYDLSWHNPFNSAGNISQLSGTADISETDNIIIQLDPSRIFLKDYECHFNDQNTIHIRPHRYEIDNLVFSTQNSSVAINGDYDTKDSSRLSMAAKNIDISLINPLLNGMSFGGRMSADLNLLNRNDRRLIFGKLITDELNMNETRLGDLFLMAGLNNNNAIRFTGGLFDSSKSSLDYEYLSNFSIRDFQQEKSIIAKLSGSYEQKSFKATADFDTLQADFLEPFLSGFCDELSGTASGELTLNISPDSSYIDGNVHVLDAEMGIAALGTRYKVIEQDILFDKEGIMFPGMKIFDKDGDSAILAGKIAHKMFKDMRLDLKINTDRILALNTPRSTNSVFYGTGYVKGDVSISGTGDNLYFIGPDIQTLKGSKIVLEVQSANSASETDQIRFVPRTSNETETVETPKSSTNLNFDFTFNVTNDADVVLLLDAIGGTLNARADGRFQLIYNNNDNLNLYGNLMLHSGDFKLSLYDVVNSKFTLMNGGTINFDGPLENMTVNISAYKTSKTSLANIIPAEHLPSGNVDVMSILRLNGPLMQRIEPTFAFELPNSSSEVRNLFYTAIDTQNTENMTKQFAYFLVTNSFMPENMFAGTGTGVPGMNMLSNMVNNLLSNVIDSKRGGFGITYNQATETTSAEYGVKANANLFNERISMSTSIGYYDNRAVANAYNNIYGDFTVEYLINPSGTWRVKAYTYIGQRDDYYYYIGNEYNNYVAGVALTYKQDFDSRKRNRNKGKGKKKDSKLEQ
ncbi:MAG: translocation/assembly module TamB domain-containing protein [Bacteroidales bacterium]|nr:translocation/assembly module TamB domain-containing protein [Bacteroidales bacterium]